MLKVIALVSPDGSGKDYFCERARSVAPSLGYKVKRFAFADQLKLEVFSGVRAVDEPLGQDGLTMDDVFTNDREKKEKIRELLKGWAMLRRNLYGSDYWARKIEEHLVDTEEPTLLIVTDLSYLNEQQIIDSAVKPENVRYVRFKVEADGYVEPDPSAHSSNWGRSNLPVDATYVNDMRPDTMGGIVRTVLSGLLEDVRAF